MARFLQQLLAAEEPLFSSTINQLESMTGRQGIDVRYIGDITRRAHAVMRQIGLDPSDTTELELYVALNNNVESAGLFSDTDDVALMYHGNIISFNHDDILENVHRIYERRAFTRVRCQIRHGLAERYRANAGSVLPSVEGQLSALHLDECDFVSYHEEKIQNKLSYDSSVPYILCVGDIFSDTFIKLLEDEARIDTDSDGSKRLSIPFGNKPPYESAEIVHSVGPSPNAAVSCARLGLRVGLMSWIGDDQVGKDSLDYLVNENIDVAPMVTQTGTPSNSYFVLRYGADRTILVKNENYDYRWKVPAKKPDWIYLSLISADSWHLHQDMLYYLSENPEVKLAFQPGTFHFKWGADRLRDVYRRSHIVVMNREEAVEVTGAPYDSLRALAEGLHELGPEIVVITDGPQGSYAFYEDTLYRIPNYPDIAPPLDRTGAGDAFASSIVAALALGKPLEDALTWAPINSMSVVQKLGAQAGLLRQANIEEYLKNAPNDYKAEEMTE